MSKIRRIALATLKYVTLVIFAIYFFVWISSPFISSYFIKRELAKHDLTLHPDSHIRYNPFKTQISIEDLSITQSNTTVFSLTSGELEIDLYRLLFDDLHINTIKLSGLQLAINLENSTVEIAGIQLPTQDAEKEPAPSENEGTNDTALPFSISSKDIRLEDHTFNISHEGTPLTFKINSVNIPPVAISTDTQDLSTDIHAHLFEGDIKLSVQASFSAGKGSIDSHINIQKISLNQIQDFLPDTIRNLEGFINFETSTKIELAGEDIHISSSNTTFVAKTIGANIENFDISSHNFLINSPTLDLTITKGEPKNIKASSSLSSQQLQIQNAETKSVELFYENLDANKLDINYDTAQEGLFKITSDNITFTNIETSKVSKPDNNEYLPALLKMGHLKISDILATNNNVNIDTIHASDLSNNIAINKDKKIVTLTTPPQSKPDTKQEDTAPEQSEPLEEEKDFSFTINNILIDGKNSLEFSDNSVSPPVLQKVMLDSFTFNNLSNTHTEQSPFSIKGSHNNHGKFDLKGSIAVFSEHVNGEIAGKITELSLPTISAYIHNSLGFELTSGQLDTAIDVAIKTSELGGDITLDIRGLSMSKTDSFNNNTLENQTAVPLNVALGMLKDKRGNIKLKVPLSGSVEDPSFGVQSFLILVTKKAILSQAKSYLVNTFVPYANVVTVAMMAGDFALKLRFEDLIYEAKNVEVSEAQHDFAHQFIKLMKDKPDTQIKLCGVATPEDAGLAKDISPENVSEETKALLRGIATSRAENFKSYVMENGGIVSSRLLVCTPQLEFGEKSKPKIKLSV